MMGNKKGQIGVVRRQLQVLLGRDDLDYDDLARLKIKYGRVRMGDRMGDRAHQNSKSNKVNTEMHEPYALSQVKLDKSVKFSPHLSSESPQKVKVRRSQGKKRVQLSEQEKRSKLQSFFQHADEMIDEWRSKERTEKVRFKTKMKLAAISPSKSEKKLTKKSEIMKHSLKNIHVKDFNMYLPTNIQHTRAQRPCEVHKVKLLPSKLKTVESELIKNHLKTILMQMEKNRKELAKDKEILKLLKADGRKQERKKKVTMIRQDVQRDLFDKKEEKMQRYRKELELELENELSFQKVQENSPRRDKVEYKQSRVIIEEQESLKKDDDKPNPEAQLPIESKYGNFVVHRSNSLIDRHRRNDTEPLKKIENLTESQRQRCEKIIQKYSTRQASPTNKMPPRPQM